MSIEINAMPKKSAHVDYETPTRTDIVAIEREHSQYSGCTSCQRLASEVEELRSWADAQRQTIDRMARRESERRIQVAKLQDENAALKAENERLQKKLDERNAVAHWFDSQVDLSALEPREPTERLPPTHVWAATEQRGFLSRLFGLKGG